MATLKKEVDCAVCGSFSIECDSLEDMRDQIALHLMLAHSAIEWNEINLPPGLADAD